MELTSELAGRVLAAAGLDGAVEAVSRRGEGTTAAVFEVRRSAAAPVVVKVYAGERRWMLAKEQHVYGLLATLGQLLRRVHYVLIEEAAPGAGQVTGVVDVENALAGDPLLDLAKTDLYSFNGRPAKLSGLLAGYGDPPGPGRWRERLALYRVYHALSLWAWFASIGTRGPLDGLADELRRLIAEPGRF